MNIKPYQFVLIIEILFVGYNLIYEDIYGKRAVITIFVILCLCLLASIIKNWNYARRYGSANGNK